MSFRQVPLAQLVIDGAISYGVVQPGTDNSEGIPLLRVKDLRGDQIDLTDPIRVAIDVSERHSRTILRGGEVLVSLVGSVGLTAVTDERVRGWNVARAIAVLRPLAEIGPQWLQLCLQSRAAQDQMRERLNTTVQATLNLADLKTIQVPVPDAGIRAAIVAVLGALDDKIAANEALARTAGDLAAARFSQWAPSTKFESLATVAPPILGGTPNRSKLEFWGPGIPWASARDVAAAPHGVLMKTVDTITSAATASAARLAPHPAGTVVLTARGTVGAVARVAMDCSINQSCYAFRASAHRSALLYLAILQGVDRMRAIAHGSVFSTITMPTIAQIRVPDIRTLPDEAAVLSESLLDTVTHRVRENQVLAELRDTLLPALMSGRLRVKDAERQVEDAV